MTMDMIIVCCDTCRYGLGGGYDNCRINLEAECAAGGYEAWEPREPDGRHVQYEDEIDAWEPMEGIEQ